MGLQPRTGCPLRGICPYLPFEAAHLNAWFIKHLLNPKSGKHNKKNTQAGSHTEKTDVH